MFSFGQQQQKHPPTAIAAAAGVGPSPPHDCNGWPPLGPSQSQTQFRGAPPILMVFRRATGAELNMCTELVSLANGTNGAIPARKMRRIGIDTSTRTILRNGPLAFTLLAAAETKEVVFTARFKVIF